MKKLILLLSIITICYACQKTTITPIITHPQNNIQQSTCGPLGDCYSGTYVFDSTATANVAYNGNVLDTNCIGLTIIMSYNGDTIINNMDFIKYKSDSLFNTTAYISNSSIININAFIWQKNSQYANTVSLETKTGKPLIFTKI